MKRSLASLLFLFFASLSASAQTRPQPTVSPTPRQTSDEDVVRISTTLIQLDVTVTDKNGKIITDLKPEDFEVLENDQKQQITNFSFVSTSPAASTSATAAAPKPKNDPKNPLPPPPPSALKPEQVRRTLALAVDDLSLSFESAAYVRWTLKKFVDEQMQEGDLVAIVRTGAGMGALQQFTSDRRLLYAAIEKVRWNPVLNGRIGTFALNDFAPPGQTGAERAGGGNRLDAEKDSLDSFGSFQSSIFAAGTLGALNYVVRGMSELPGRKSIVLFSEGFVIPVVEDENFARPASFKENLRRLLDLANRASVVIYAMDPRGLETLNMTPADSLSRFTPSAIPPRKSFALANMVRDTQEGLRFLAEETGGFALVNNNDLSGGIRRALNEQNSYYLIGYVPDDETFDPKKRRYNKLKIKVNRPGAKVRYRSGFFGVSDESVKSSTANSAVAKENTPGQQLARAITSPFSAGGVTLRLNALFANDTRSGSFVHSFLHINATDLKFTDEPEDTHKATFEILAISFGDNGQIVDQIAQSYTVSLKGERYQKFLREGFIYKFVFPVKKPGAYQLRVALRDSATAKVGSASQFIEVPNLKKGMPTLSGIVLENMTLDQYQNLQASVINTGTAVDPVDLRNTSQADTSLRRFKRGTVLRYGFEIYNAKIDPAIQKPQLMQQIRIFRDGKLVHDGKPLPLDPVKQDDWKKIATTGAFVLGAEMTPGDYALQVIVTDNLAKEKRRLAAQFIQFEVTE